MVRCPVRRRATSVHALKDCPASASSNSRLAWSPLFLRQSETRLSNESLRVLTPSMPVKPRATPVDRTFFDDTGDPTAPDTKRDNARLVTMAWFSGPGRQYDAQPCLRQAVAPTGSGLAPAHGAGCSGPVPYVGDSRRQQLHRHARISPVVAPGLGQVVTSDNVASRGATQPVAMVSAPRATWTERLRGRSHSVVARRRPAGPPPRASLAGRPPVRRCRIPQHNVWP